MNVSVCVCARVHTCNKEVLNAVYAVSSMCFESHVPRIQILTNQNNLFNGFNYGRGFGCRLNKH